MRCVYFIFTLQTMFVGTFPFITKTMYLCIWRDVILLKRTSGCVYFTLTSQSMCTLLLHHKACVLYSYITMHVYFTLTSQSMWFAAFSLLLQKPRLCVYVLYLYANKLKIVVKLISKLSCTVHVFYIDIFVMQKI